MRQKQVRAQYTREFKLEAVRQVRSGQAIAVVAKVLGISKASLGNWVRLAVKGEISGAGDDDKVVKVSSEQMEIARLRAENAEPVRNFVCKCRIPDDCIDSKRYPLFMARAGLQELIESLQSTQGVKPC